MVVLTRPSFRHGQSRVRTPVAYLGSIYPGLSLAFIDREMAALRLLGREVVSVSVRPADPDDLRTEHARQEAARTLTILGGGSWRVLTGAATFALRHPLILLAGLLRALRTGAPRARNRLWQVFYLVEGIVLLDILGTAGVRHVHVHFANNAADIARAAVELGNARDGGGWTWSFSMHGPTEFEDPMGFDLAAKVRSASMVACITDYCRSQLMRWTTPDLWSRLHLVRMSVDVERYRYVERSLRDPADPLRVLFVGRLVPEKGPTVLLEAVAGLRDVPVQVQVVGKGPLAGELQRTIVARGLGDRVELVGPLGQDELPERYAWADVLCLPSFAEGLPVVLMEALATGLPVVTTPIAGIGELVEDGQTGLLTPPGRADLLGEAFRQAHSDPDLRHRLGLEGRRRIDAGFLPGPNAATLDTLLP